MNDQPTSRKPSRLTHAILESLSRTAYMGVPSPMAYLAPVTLRVRRDSGADTVNR
jgi:hypothetical protein